MLQENKGTMIQLLGGGGVFSKGPNKKFWAESM